MDNRVARAALANFYGSCYTKSELTFLLADIVLGLKPPPAAPPSELLLLGGSPRGRPSSDVTDARKAILLQLIAAQYPAPYSIAEAATMIGSHYNTVIRWQSDPAFLQRVQPAELREYFLGWSPRPVRVRLSPLWRGLLDVHNYMLELTTAADPDPDSEALRCARLPLYSMHTPMWRDLGAVGLTQRVLAGYDSIERARLVSPHFMEVLSECGLPQVIYEDRESPIDHASCDLVNCFVEKMQLLVHSEATFLLETACPSQANILAPPTGRRLDTRQPQRVALQLLKKGLTDERVQVLREGAG